MGTYNVKPLESYVEKHGEEKGKKVWERELKKKARYDNQPFQRLTREWFLWRYGEELGLQKFQDHVNKSRQSLENFTLRYGEELGLQKFQETVAKKDTVGLLYQRHQKEEADELRKQRYEKANVTKEENEKLLSSEARVLRKEQRNKKSKVTRDRNRAGRTNLQIYIDRFGDSGPEEYGKYLQKIFKKIGHSREAETLILQIIDKEPWLLNYSLFYRSSLDSKKSEWFLSSKEGIFFYDFCVRETKTILEYDGARWHPSEDEAREYEAELMVITGISFREAFERDLRKKRFAQALGYDVFTIRSDMTGLEKQCIINSFLEKVKENGQIRFD